MASGKIKAEVRINSTLASEFEPFISFVLAPGQLAEVLSAVAAGDSLNINLITHSNGHVKAENPEAYAQ